MADGVNKFLGDSPGRVIVKLLVVSIIVGFVMAVFGWTPYGILYTVRDFVLDLWHSGFAALGRVGDYLLLGAAVVIPALHHPAYFELPAVICTIRTFSPPGASFLRSGAVLSLGFLASCGTPKADPGRQRQRPDECDLGYVNDLRKQKGLSRWCATRRPRRRPCAGGPHGQGRQDVAPDRHGTTAFSSA